MEVSSPIDRFLEDETPSDEIIDGTGGAPKDSWVFLGGKQVRASSINVAILGSGSFGTSMGVYLAGKGVNVTGKGIGKRMLKGCSDPAKAQAATDQIAKKLGL